MTNYSTATIEGFATQDAVLRHTKTGKTVFSFSIAVNHYAKADSDPKVSFVDVEAWEKTGEICAKNITKSKRIIIIGNLRQDRWEGKDGKPQSKIKIVAKNIRFVENMKKSESPEQIATP